MEPGQQGRIKHPQRMTPSGISKGIHTKGRDMTTEIAVVEATALTSHRAATNAAGLCRDLVVKTAMRIQGRRYVQVEGWQAIANAFGCVASARSVERIEGGFRATGQVIRVADGTVIAEAEGFVGDDEKTWASRPVFARRAMAQTRAMSRACRSAFAFVVTLMDAGLETTPAEEMSAVVEAEPVVVRPRGTKSQTVAPGVEVHHVESFEQHTPDITTEPASVVTLKSKRAAPEITDPVAKARLAVSRAKTLEDCDTLRDLITTRHTEGVFTDADVAELVKLLHGKAELLIGSEEVATHG